MNCGKSVEHQNPIHLPLPSPLQPADFLLKLVTIFLPLTFQDRHLFFVSGAYISLFLL